MNKQAIKDEVKYSASLLWAPEARTVLLLLVIFIMVVGFCTTF